MRGCSPRRAVQSDALVTGDKNLLDVAELAPIPILSPRDC